MTAQPQVSAPFATVPQTRPWLASYQPGVPQTIELPVRQTINELFDKAVKDFSSHRAVESFGVSYSYAELGRYADAIAAWLQAQGLQPGDRVGIMMPNVAAYPPLLAGILKAGCIVVNINPLYVATELSHQLRDSGAKTVFVLAQFEHTVKAARQTVPLDRVVRVHLGDLLGLKGRLITFMGGRKSPPKADGQCSDAIAFTTVIAQGSQLSVRPVDVKPEDLAFLQYTGGTTGVAKGAALRHSNLMANSTQMDFWLYAALPSDRKPDIMVTALPLYHIYALMACWLNMMRRGGCLLLIANPRDTVGFIKTLKTRPFTMIAGVNTLYNALCNVPAARDVKWDQLIATLAGGMATQRVVAQKWKAMTGNPIIEGYGLSETSPCICFNRADTPEFTGTVGLPWPSTDVSLRNSPTGQEVALGDVGELCVKGPQVMVGYWNKPDETAKAMTADGYFRTGDLALMLPDGQIKIVDRLKEMIIVSGFNVYPNEVEDVLATHPKVLEAAVIGLPDVHSGEAVHAYVVRRDETLTAEELRAYCRQSLTQYKVPKSITFRATLPKSPVGKILRRELRDEITAIKT